jgi:hypothetical protein
VGGEPAVSIENSIGGGASETHGEASRTTRPAPPASVTATQSSPDPPNGPGWTQRGPAPRVHQRTTVVSPRRADQFTSGSSVQARTSAVSRPSAIASQRAGCGPSVSAPTAAVSPRSACSSSVRPSATAESASGSGSLRPPLE